jgi:hypothetical protein
MAPSLWSLRGLERPTYPKQIGQTPRPGGYDGPGENYDGPKDGYEGPKSGYEGPKDRQDGPQRGYDRADGYDGPAGGYDGPDPSSGRTNPR